VLLARLLDHRRLAIEAVAQAAGVPESELRNVVGGLQPAPALLQALAPALDLHEADLYVIAGYPVPDALSPLDASARKHIQDLVNYVICLPGEQRSWLRRLVRELPQEPREHPFAAWKVFHPHRAGFGAMVANMLYVNRNLGGSEAAVVLACCSNGRMYVSPSTMLRIATGRSELTPDRLAGLATLLDIPAGDLAAITGIALPDGHPPEDPTAADVAALLWDVRRLSAGRLGHVRAQAYAMRSEIPDDAIDRGFYAIRPYRSPGRTP
jgi:transcriptional regulator with XRE-family HTH domain